jgi:CO/xanthine dehydrogenase FAD-binding subunit
VNSDIHANAEYRTAMTAVIARRAIEKAIARVG